MNRQAVQSAAVKSVGFEDGVLEIELTGGRIYRATDATQADFDDWLNAKSKGKHLGVWRSRLTRVDEESER